MTDMESDGISDEILDKAQADISALLSNRKLPRSERVQLEIQSYILMFNELPFVNRGLLLARSSQSR